MKSKYREDVLCLVERDKIKSTRQIQRELEKKAKKTINWFMVYKILHDLETDGRVKKFEATGGIFWIKA